jgi:hypothetical protein
LTFDISAEIVANVPAKSQLTAEVVIEVKGGCVGIAWIDHESQLTSAERVVLAKSGIQHVIVSAGSDEVHRLMVRNVAPDRNAVFSLKSVCARLGATTPPEPVASIGSESERKRVSG